MTCDECGIMNLDKVIMCDVTMKSYCYVCWKTTACFLNKHGEGCPTLVFEDEDARRTITKDSTKLL